MTTFEGDVLLFNTRDGGEINFVNGQPKMTGGFETMIYLCLFGGNFEDDGLPGNKKTWWGNIDETDPSKRYVSRFQNLIHSGIPLNSGTLIRLQQTALIDLEIFKTSGIAGEVTAEGSITGLNRLKMLININSPEGENAQVEFLINWETFSIEQL